MPLLTSLSRSSLKHHKSLLPLLGCIVGGGGLAAGYLARLAFKCPDVSWKTPYPWQHMKHTDQYWLYSPTVNYEQLPHLPRIEASGELYWPADLEGKQE